MNNEDLNRVKTHIKKSLIDVNLFDIAMSVYILYKHVYVVTSIKHNFWYQFDNVKWIPSESGPYFQISTCILDIYKSVLQELKHSKSSKTKQKNCNESISILKDIYTKEKIMKECTYLFYDHNFLNKLDTHTHLIPFNNGVYNLQDGTFRDGKCSDYLSCYISSDFLISDNKSLDSIDNFIEYRNRLVLKKSQGTTFYPSTQKM